MLHSLYSVYLRFKSQSRSHATLYITESFTFSFIPWWLPVSCWFLFTSRPNILILWQECHFLSEFWGKAVWNELIMRILMLTVFVHWLLEPVCMLVAGHLLSPSPTPHMFTRWSTSRLNSGGTSTSTSPCGSTRSSFNYRQPYLGWRSQERLTRPRTPAERLAAGLLPTQQQQQVTSPQGVITQQQTQQDLQQLLQQEAELRQLQQEDEEQVGRRLAQSSSRTVAINTIHCLTFLHGR